jgi:hypothetical protein
MGVNEIVIILREIGRCLQPAGPVRSAAATTPDALGWYRYPAATSLGAREYYRLINWPPYGFAQRAGPPPHTSQLDILPSAWQHSVIMTTSGNQFSLTRTQLSSSCLAKNRILVTSQGRCYGSA